MSVDPAEQSKIRTFIGDLVSIVGFVVLASVVLALIAFVITRWNDPEIRKIAPTICRRQSGFRSLAYLPY